MELKRDLKKNKLSALQVATALQYYDNLITLFVTPKILILLPNTLQQTSLEFLKQYYEKKLYKYQETSLSKALQHKRFLLALDMGLGKAFTGLKWLEAIKKQTI
ncbi:hypothetical protein ACW95P_04110 [Candidatus Mycoplasma pogonae]